MPTFQSPTVLNPLQRYSQACSILRNTTRAKNPAWYQEALDLTLQLHIRPDGVRLLSSYFDAKKNEWSQGPQITGEMLNDPGKLEPLVAEILKHARSKGSHSLGIILHIADEFATTELKPELDNPGALPELRQAAIDHPATILEDSSILATKASWRVIPYPAAGSDVIGTTVTISRQYAPFLGTLREAGEVANFPIITHALSAPLVSLMGLPQAVTNTPGKAFVAILQYPWFTVLAFFNEHADLRLIRTLQHRGLRKPPSLRNALTTSCASLELVDPDLFLLPLGEEIDSSLEDTLRANSINCRVEVIRHELPAALTSWCPEPWISAVPPISTPAITSHTFEILSEDRWALQDFLPIPKEVIEIYPTRAEMRLLRVVRLARLAVALIALGGLAYVGNGIIELVRRPEWSFNMLEADAIKSRLSKLIVEKQKVEHWNNLLEDRSKAWCVMESMARMFPENSGMLLKTFTHMAKPDNAPGQSQLGFIKEWRITGFARDEALETLNSLNTREGIASHFSEIARITGNLAFKPTIGNRNLTVNVRTQENSAFKPIPLEDTTPADETTYPFSFDMTITQRFEATDPMSIKVPKKP